MNDIASIRKTRPLPPFSPGAFPLAGDAADFSAFASAATPADSAALTVLAFSRSARFWREIRVFGIPSRIAGWRSLTHSPTREYNSILSRRDCSMFIPIILGSTCRGRQSAKIAKFIHTRLSQQPEVETEVLDLAEYNFPIMEERLRMRDDPPARVPEFSEKLQRADAIVIVTPEYNNGYPGVLKNALDYFYPEYKRKPVGIVTVSAGGFGGINCLAQLRLVTLALGAYPIPASFPVSSVNKSFADDGTPQDPATTDKRVAVFFDELLWATRAFAAAKKQ